MLLPIKIQCLGAAFGSITGTQIRQISTATNWLKECQMKHYPLLILSVLTISSIGPAQADGRGDVLAGILRCSGIADDRTWLDCLYGSAEPMRARLGLQPAPAAQVRLVPPALPGAPPVHLVEEGVAPPTKVAKVEPGLIASIVGDFGHPLVSKVAMASYEFNNSGMFTVALTNGQIWTQVGDSDRHSLAHWHGPASRLITTITPGALGTVNLVVAGEARLYKVRRLQ